VIDTTTNHLFWVPGATGRSGRWVKAAALRYGTHLRTPAGGYATAAGGWTPKTATGWMWDLTIPGDHDFYIDTIAAPVLVHNCSNPLENARYSAKSSNRCLGHQVSTIHSPNSFRTASRMITCQSKKGLMAKHTLMFVLKADTGATKAIFHWIIDNQGVVTHRMFEP
jgi:hypothetical protein